MRTTSPRRSRQSFLKQAAALERLEPRQLLCGIPHQPVGEAPIWSDAIEQQHGSAAEGGPEAVSIVWSNRGQASDNFASTFGTSAEAGRLVVDAALRHWERVITSFNRSDGTSTLQVNVSISGLNVYGGAGSPAATAPSDGRPRTGSFTLTPGVATPNANDSNGWYFDPRPDDWSEFDGGIVNAYAGNTTAAIGSDFYTVAVSEMAHVLGLISDKNNNGGSWNGYRLETSGLAAPTGIRDNAEGGGNFGYFWVFDGPNVDRLMTSYNSGDATDASWGNIIHTAGGAGNVNFNGRNWRGAEDAGNAASTERMLPSWTVAQMLADAYGYTIVDPETFGTMHASLNTSNGVLTIRGSSTATSSDVIILNQENSDLLVSVDIGEDVPGTGPLPGAGNIDAYVTRFPLASVNSIVINGGGGTDYVRVEDSAGKPVQINGEGGDDFIDFAFYSQNLTNIDTASISVSGGPGFDQVYCYDNANFTSDPFTITGSRFDRAGWAGFFYSSDIEALNLTTGTAANTVNVLSTFANQPIYLFSAAGADTVNIGNSTNGIRSINANVTINNDPSFTTLNINNGPDTGARTWNVDGVGNLGYVIGMAPANIYWDNADIQAINLTCGSGVDTGQFVISTETFNVNNAGSNDFIRIGVPAASGLSLISGQITIDNSPAFTTLTIDDTGSSIPRTINFDEAGGYNTVSGFGSAFIRFDSVDTESTKIITGSSSDTINVPRNDDTLILSSSGSNDTVNLGNATNGLQSIVGSVRVMNPPSFTTININDGPNTVSRTPILDNVTFEGALYGSWSQLAPALIEYKYSDLAAVNVTFGSGADVIAIRKSQGVLNLTTTNGADAYTIGGSADGAQSVLGEITLQNPPNHNSITVNDTGNLLGRTATLDDTLIGGLPYGWLSGLAPANIYWKYNDTNAVNLIHGSGNDTLNVRRHQDALTVQGTAGSDTLTLGGVAGIGMNGVTAPVTASNTSGATTLVLDDSGDTADGVLIHEMNTLLLGRVTGMSPAPIDYRFGQVNTVRLRTSQGGYNSIVVIHETSLLTRVFYEPGAIGETLQVNEDSLGSAALYTNRNVNPNSVLIGNGGAIYQLTGGFVFRSSVHISFNGLLDISDGALIYDYDEGNPLELLQEKVIQGYNGGNWLGLGIRSSTAAATPGTGVGYANASALFSSFPATFAGQSVDDTTVLVRYTLFGDSNLDRAVNLDDFTALASNFGLTGRVFSQGDFNYDGSVNLDDFTILASQFGKTLPASGDTPGRRAVASGTVINGDGGSSGAMPLESSPFGATRRESIFSDVCFDALPA